MVILDLTNISEINKKSKMKVYVNDTKKTFINRLVFSLNNQFKLNLLPEYIYIPDFNFEKDEMKIESLKELSKNYTDINSFTLFFKESKKWELSPKMLFKIWITNVPDIFLIDPQYQYFTLKYVNDNVLKMTDDEFKELIKDIPKFSYEIQEDVNQFMKDVKNEILLENKFNNIKGTEFTQFVEEKRKILIEISNNFSNLLDFFDISKLNKYVPYINVKHNVNNQNVEYTKISKSFNYFPDMVNSITDKEFNLEYQTSSMNFYIYNLNELTNDLSFKMYTLIQIMNVKDKFNMELTVRTKQLDLDNIKHRIQNMFTQTIHFSNEKNIYIGGLFYIPNTYFDKYILADLCMSDELFQKFLKIDESLRAYRKKSSVYVYFTDPRYPKEYLTASISQKFMEKSDFKHVEDREKFKIGSSYVRIKVSRAKSLHHVFRFQEILSKLFVEYNKKVDEIIDVYQEFIPKFGEIPKIEIQEQKLKLKDIVPEQFISNYTRLCSKPPNIIFPDEKEKYLKKYPDRQTIIFPKNIEEGTQHEYICTDDIYKYPGIKENTLENKSKFKYLPCCYTKDQSERKNYKDYYKNIQVQDEQIINDRIIITNKILNSDAFGVLPEYLNKLLVSIKPNYDFYRKGVSRTKNSFIECIAEIFDPEYKQFQRDDDRILPFLEKIREDLSDTSYLAITRQEEYDKDIDEIRRNILNMDMYFDPKKYYCLLEKKYNCNIYLFNENEMTIPTHLQNYLRYHKRYPNSVFIFEHFGSESDNAIYPQCEIISGIDPFIGDNTQFYSLPYNNIISIQIEKIFIKYNESYLYNHLSYRIKIPSKLKPISQSIDGYGKTRILYLKYLDLNQENHLISLYTNPLPPLGIKEQQVEYNEIKQNIAIELFDYLDIPIHHQTVVNEHCVEISGFYENILYTCPVYPSKILKNITKGYNKIIVPKQKSKLQMFNDNLKKAKHLSQLFLYTFSEYFQHTNENVQKSEKITDNVYKDFIEKRIEKITDYKYNKFNKIVSQNSQTYKNNKLIIGGQNPDETLKRLMYFLRLNIERNRNMVMEYYSKEYIYDFYNDITDFVKRENEIIIPGENALNQWVQEKNIDKKMHLEIDPNTSLPYFIKTTDKSLLDKKVYLCNNDIELKNCMTRQYYWNKMKYNPEKISTFKHSDIEILKYKNMHNIESIKTGKYKVLGYLQDKKVKYTTLLDV